MHQNRYQCETCRYGERDNQLRYLQVGFRCSTPITARAVRTACRDARCTPDAARRLIEGIDDIRSNIVLRRVVERLERSEINGAIHELVALTPRDAIAADANGEGEREAPWRQSPPGRRQIRRNRTAPRSCRNQGQRQRGDCHGSARK
ncbi:MAG: hypothetical protein EOS70_15700 [Mesorhizobium sp.]|nr:MAG: hypothetical protein EOS70_15700 [Mesorhizobium sp.]